MKASRSSSELLNLDVLALSLLCCLLASVVGVLVLGGEGNAEASTEPNKDKVETNESSSEAWAALKERTTILHTRVQDIENSRAAISNLLLYSILEHENADMEGRIQKIQSNKSNLIAQIQATNLEIERVSRELAGEAKKQDVHFSPQVRRMLGEYKGSYVLIECVENGAIVYPGGQSIDLSPSTVEISRLLDQITNAGFVAFVVRPAGWFNNSYNKLQKLIYARLDSFEQNTGKYIGRSAFPITADASITNYVPPKETP